MQSSNFSLTALYESKEVHINTKMQELNTEHHVGGFSEAILIKVYTTHDKLITRNV